MAAPGPNNGPPPSLTLNRAYTSHTSSQAHTNATLHHFLNSIKSDIEYGANTALNKKKLTIINNLLGLTLQQFINTTGINLISRETIYEYVNQRARAMPNMPNMMNVNNGGRRKRTRRAKRSRRTRRHRKH